MQEAARRVGAFFLDTIQTVVLALSIFVIAYLFLLQPHQVKGNSMSPYFQNNDFLLTDKISYRFNEPQRGEVIIFKAPKSEICAEEECEYIKRIIGLPGEKVKLQEGIVYINNQRLGESYLTGELKTQPQGFLTDGRVITLGEEEYLVFGDNRPYSRDGREFGPIKRSSIVGKAWVRYWPLAKIGIIPEISYAI